MLHGSAKLDRHGCGASAIPRAPGAAVSPGERDADGVNNGEVVVSLASSRVLKEKAFVGRGG